MRVIAGSAKGRKLKTLDGDEVRPTTDKVKEAIFSSIQFDLPQAVVLDLFAGSGQMGIEALSRGAEKVVFVDISSKSLSVTKENLSSLDMLRCSELFQTNAIDFLDRNDGKYDIAILDPPYRKNLILQSLKKMGNHINYDGTVICEHESELELTDKVENFFVKKRYNYGKISVTVYKKREEVDFI